MGQRLSIINPTNAAQNNSWLQVDGNANPYDTNIIVNNANITQVTSIPSPYARMHLFEIAFQKLANGNANHPDELKKCVSNCLDVFELFYRCRNDKGLRDAGLSVELHRYKDIADVNGNRTEKEYLDALCLFRKGYCNLYNDHTLFKVFFTICKDSHLIAATSPFTGFYLREDNDITIEYEGKKYFSPIEHDTIDGTLLWNSLNQRGRDFQEFMFRLVYYLINNIGNSFPDRYADLWKYICNQIPVADQNTWMQGTFADLYPEFDFAGINTCTWGFPIFTQNPRWNGQDVHVIPNAFDCSFLRYMLVPQENASFKLKKEDYADDIINRRNPINGTHLAWVSVDDFLDDKIVIIQGEINRDKYFTIEDQNNTCNVIPPLTERFFEFFKVDDLRGNGMGRVRMSLKSDLNPDYPTYYITLDIPYRDANNGISYLTLSKTYSGFDQCIMNVNIELGIFPFIKTPANVDDFYRIVLYANKDLKLNDLEIIQLNNGYFNNSNVLSDDGQYIRRRFTNGNMALSTALHTDLLYYSLESTFNAQTGLMNHKDVSFDLLKIKYCIDKPTERVDCEVIIVPFMEQEPNGAANVKIAIDFGTSNTFVAYNTSGNAAGTKDFETTQSTHCGDSLFVKFAKLDNANPNFKEKFDFINNRLTQRCEFLPAYFNNANGFKFPIPSILNIRNLQDSILKDYENGSVVSTLDANIPFAYYDDGVRVLSNGTIDNIREGFKWINATDSKQKGLIYLYLDELLLLLRSRILSQGIDITNAKLYFTYPLAFSDNLTLEYKKIARMLYAKYFNLSINTNICNKKDIIDEGKVIKDIEKNVIFDNESKTPLFSDTAIIGAGQAAVGKVMSADIGGGSCDIMIYNRATQVVEKCFSFKFAGNNLFGSGRIQNKDNVWFKDVAKQILPSVTDANGINGIQKKIMADDSSYDIVNLMNSLFVNDVNKVNINIANSGSCSFITLLFSSAIFYQMASICRASGVIPDKIFLSGSGSRLLNMQQNRTPNFDRNRCNEQIGKVIFAAVIPDQATVINGHAFDIVSSATPKAATAYGILAAACSGIAGGGVNEHWIDYGENEGHVYRQLDTGQIANPNNEPTPYDISVFQDDFNSEQKPIYTSVKKNVDEFFSVFFSAVLPRFAQLNAKYTYDSKGADVVNGKINIYDIINRQFDSIKNGYNDTINGAQPGKYLDSLFLKIISRIISDLCKAL